MEIQFLNGQYVITNDNKIIASFTTLKEAKRKLKTIKFAIANKEFIDKGLQVIPFLKIASLPVSTKVRNDYADYDYVQKLTGKDLNFLKAFNREYYNADFKHEGKRLFKGIKRRKARYDENNARNRDIYAISKCAGNLDILDIRILDGKK